MNMSHVANSPQSRPTNSDLAFWKKLVFAGNYGGFRIIDASKPSAPRVLADVSCPGAQGDVGIYGNDQRRLLFVSVDSPQATSGCSGSPEPNRFEGIRIFDVSDPRNPTFVPRSPRTGKLRGDTMTRGKKVKKARRAQAPPPKPQPRFPRELRLFAVLAAIGLIAAGVLLWQRDDGAEPLSDEAAPLSVPTTDPGPVHVHGLGVNPADDALFIATHTGLYRVDAGERKAERVGDRLQDTMGFTIVGPNRFLGSGHPDLNEAREKNLPSLLGLIESTDKGESWQPISLSGEADFHVLRFTGERVYGYDASNDRLLVSADRGRSWNELEKPGPIVDLAVDPSDDRRILVASAGGVEEGLFESRDGGGSWKRVSEAIGLLAWPDRLYLVAASGQVFVSADGGRRFEQQGEIGGQPAALVAEGPSELYAALHDGTIKRSTDGGETWPVRSTP